MKDNRTYKSGAKSIIMNNNCSLDLNRSMTNSIITSSYIILKDGTKKRKRHMNSYMEEFLEKRRMAAEFAQSKRSTSSKNPKVRVDKNLSSSNDYKYNINIKKIEEVISINNLKNNLPGKTKALIDNTNLQNSNEKNEPDNKANALFQDNSNKYSKYINVSNKEEINKESETKSLIINNQNINNNFYINEQNNYNISNANTDKDYLEKKYNNIQRHNIVYTKKKENINSKNLSNHSFTENRYSSMYQDNDIDDQCNMGNMELLGPQLPEEAFLGSDNNNKYTISKDININYENNIQNTDKKSLSKDIKDNKNFKDISPIKPNINIQSQNNSGKIYSLNEEDADIDIDNVNIKKVNKSEHFISLMQRMINKNSTNENDLYALNLKKNETEKENIKNNNNIILDKQNEIEINKNIELFNYNSEQKINANVENNNNIKNIKNIEYKKFINKTEEVKVEDNLIDSHKNDEENNNNDNIGQEQFNLQENNEKKIILNEEHLNNSDEKEHIDIKNMENDKNDSNNNENNLDISQNNEDNHKNDNNSNNNIKNNENSNNNEKMAENNINDNGKEYENNNKMEMDIKINENININNNIQNKDTFDIIDKEKEKDEKSNNELLKSDKIAKNISISDIQNPNLNINKMNLMKNQEQKFLEEYVVEENEENNVVITREEEENDEQDKSINKQDEEKNENYNDEEENDDIERCEVLKGDELRDKSKYLKGKNNIITEEIEEVEEAQEANENTSEFANSKSNRKHMYTPMIITQNNFEIKNNSNNKESVKSRNKVKEFCISNQNIFIPQQKENKKEVKDNKDIEDYIVNEKRNADVKQIINEDNIKYNNLSKVEIIDFKGNKNEQIYYKKNINYTDKNRLNEQKNEKANVGDNINNDMITNTNIKNNYNINNYQNDENNEIYKSNNIDIFNNINNFKKDIKEESNQFKNNIVFNEENINELNSINKINNITNNNINANTNIDISNNENNDNYSNNNYINNTVNNIEKESSINNKEKEEFIKVINQDIERLEKIRNNNIGQETKEEDSYIYEIDNFINLMKEKRKSTEANAIKELMYNRDEYNSQQKYNFYEIKKNLNANNDYNNINDISDNKVKLNINKSSRLQTLLNNLKKEKINDKFKYDIFNNSNDYNKENMGEISYNIFNEKYNEIEDENNGNDRGKIDKLFDETMFRKIKERNFNNKNNYRKEFQLKDYGTNKNHSHVYLDKVKEDLMNISATKIMNKNELNKKRIPVSRLVYSNANNNDIDIEIMPANNMSSLYKKNYK